MYVVLDFMAGTVLVKNSYSSVIVNKEVTTLCLSFWDCRKKKAIAWLWLMMDINSSDKLMYHRKLTMHFKAYTHIHVMCILSGNSINDYLRDLQISAS